jgi:anti-sigma B factor antagonist
VRIEVKFYDDVAAVHLSGKFLAGGDGPFLRQKVKELIDAGTRKLIIDFSEVPYIDSTGLGFLAGTHVTAKMAGVRMILASLNVHVRSVLDGVQLSQFFVIEEDEAAALAKLKEPSTGSEDSGPFSGKNPKAKKRA